MKLIITTYLFSLIQISQIVSFQHTNVKITINIFYIVIASPNLDNKFPLDITDLVLEFIKYTVEKVGSHTQVVPKVYVF